MGDVTLDRDTGGELVPCPGSICLAYSHTVSHKLEPWLAVVVDLTAIRQAAAVLYPMDYVLWLPTVYWNTV